MSPPPHRRSPPGFATRVLLAASLALAGRAAAEPPLPVVRHVARQPLAAAARALTRTLDALGTPLAASTRAALDAAYREADDAQAVGAIQAALDPHCLVAVDVNPESRVKAVAGPAKPELVEVGWRTFLLKVTNAAGVTAPLDIRSPQAAPLHGAPPDEIGDRWLALSAVGAPTLSGLEVEYRVVQLYSRDAGRRAATLAFDVGQGTQDLGFRGEVPILFTARPATDVTFRITDTDGTPATASLLIRDAHGHIVPSQLKRLAPDFLFQRQVYRADGERLRLAPGAYTVEATRGPEYLPVVVNATVGDTPAVVSVALRRWIDMKTLGYWSGDHHIHAAGCSHYTNPTQGVAPADMLRHVRGEDLNVGCTLTWGPCFDYQKRFFTGRTDPASQPPNLLRYDLEVSGFGSHRAGHLVLLGLRDMHFPGGESDRHWPTLGLTVLRWAKRQGALTGTAHSGLGIRNVDRRLPSFRVPAYDGIGANEFIVDVTHEVPGSDGAPVPAIDFFSTVDTDPLAELNMWYHVLNCGFRVRTSGETDFPCISGERVGMGRSYVQLDRAVTVDAWLDGIRHGRSYVSEGRSHLIDMRLDDVALGAGASELRLAGPATARLTATVAAYLPERPAGDIGLALPWHIEHARIPGTRTVKVEAVVNGVPVAAQVVTADGTLQPVAFPLRLERSSWVALRILPSSHTNPIFVVVDGRPIRASRRSAEWALAGVDRCWTSKRPFYAASERAAAEAAYAHARQVYRAILAESPVD
jgi:hypothetical protein